MRRAYLLLPVLCLTAVAPLIGGVAGAEPPTIIASMQAVRPEVEAGADFLRQPEPRITLDLPTNPGALRVDRVLPRAYRLTVADDPELNRESTNSIGYWKWWMFRVDGAAGQTLTFTVDNPANGHKWSTLNPVYMNGGDLDSLDAFAADPRGRDAPPQRARNGATLPDTAGQRWHFILDTAAHRDGLTFTHRFTADRVWVAMRYPFTPDYLAMWLGDLAARAEADEGLELRQYNIGNTVGGYPMHIVTIGEDHDHPRPTLLFYAREHAQDHDASFTVQGAAEYLLSDDPRALRLRKLYTFVLIPMLDPEGAARGHHNRIRSGFREEADLRKPEGGLYHDWLMRWVGEFNQRVDLVINLHNFENNEIEHAGCWVYGPAGELGRETKLLERAVFERMAAAGYDMQDPPHGGSLMGSRFSGLISRETGAAASGWMVNMQGKGRHLTLAELRDLGRVFVLGATDRLAE